MPSSPPSPVATDAQRALALSALADFAPMDAVGPLVATHAEPDGITVLQFTCGLPGYPGWLWTVALANIDDDAPTVVEAQLMPDDGALVAPEWVPWSVRLTEYLEAQRKASLTTTCTSSTMQQTTSTQANLSVDLSTTPQRTVAATSKSRRYFSPSRSTTYSMHATRARTSSGSIAVNVATRNWLRPNFR